MIMYPFDLREGVGLGLQHGRSPRLHPGRLRFFAVCLMTLYKIENTVDRVKYKIQKRRLAVFNFGH